MLSPHEAGHEHGSLSDKALCGSQLGCGDSTSGTGWHPSREHLSYRTVNLIHRTEWWAWWSDQQLTTAIGLPADLQPQGLAPDAVALITDVWCSDSPSPRCSWGTLAQVQRILQCETVQSGMPGGSFRPETWERLTVVWCNEQQGVLYRFWRGYEEGYLCQIWAEPPDLSA